MSLTQKTREEVERIVGTALKPLLKRIASLEKDSHPPVNLLPIIQEEVQAALTTAPASDLRIEREEGE